MFSYILYIFYMIKILNNYIKNIKIFIYFIIKFNIIEFS